MKKLILSVLMLGVMFMLAGSVSADPCHCGDGSINVDGEQCDDGNLIDGDGCSSECLTESCELIIDEPLEGEWYDPVDVLWHYWGGCDILDQELYYHEETCESFGSSIEELDNAWQREYEWDVSELDDGDYCVCVYGEQRDGLPGVEGCSGIFHLDTTPPESELYFGEPSEVIGDFYYINTNTPITIECEDSGSGVDTIYYNIYIDDGEGGWELIHELSEGDDDVEFYCHEESRHKIEYWCVDNVEKVEEPHNEEIFYVDTTAPIITKEIVGPQIGDCPPEEEDECWIADHETQIFVYAEDPLPHPVDDVQCEWGYWLDEQEWFGWYEYVEPIIFEEDTVHDLVVRCWDALGNGEDDQYWDYETFYVDSSAPTTLKWYDGPFYENEWEWINGVTTVNFEAWDNPSYGPHEEQICAVGVDKTEYRVSGALADRFCEDCENWMESLRPDMGDWMTYVDPFTMEESCHVIEYRSVDSLGNTEEIQWQCVFVDKTAPTTIKEVGKPSHNCDGFWEVIVGKCEEAWDWIITMNTEIELSCEDQGPHPSGTGEICYRWYLDGELGEDWNCVEDEEVVVQFYEESEHLLEFYCVDNVGKTSEIDSELFKVEGEEFTIELLKKWNLISIPFNLISNNIEEVFDQISEDIEVVWSYDADGWHVYSPEGPSDLETIEPGYGYWVKATEDTELVVGGSLLGPGPGVPPSRPLEQGWNLIGHYGLSEKEAYCSLFSLVDTTAGHPLWSALYGYDASSDEFESINSWDLTYPGKGYWVEMDAEDNYNPATICWGFYP